jgi:hypothetical protein
MESFIEIGLVGVRTIGEHNCVSVMEHNNEGSKQHAIKILAPVDA